MNSCENSLLACSSFAGRLQRMSAVQPACSFRQEHSSVLREFILWKSHPRFHGSIDSMSPAPLIVLRAILPPSLSLAFPHPFHLFADELFHSRSPEKSTSSGIS